MFFQKKYAIIVVIFIQFFVILGLAVSQQLVLEKGVEVHLTIAPRDPRDLFRGDYVILNYNISSVSYSANSSSDKAPQSGDAIYVTLNNYSNNLSDWSVSGTALNSPSYSNPENEIVIQGEVVSSSIDYQYCYSYTRNDCERSSRRRYNVRVNYGIENYYIPEGSGQQLPSFNNAYSIVFVDKKTYKAVLKEVQIDQKKWPQ